MRPLLQVKDLKIYYKTIWGDLKSVDGVTFEVYENEVFSIAGESGCGKSTLVDGILRLIAPPGYIAGGEVIFEGVDLLKLPEKELNKIRWTEIAYIPQGAMNSLNPVIRVEEQMIDAILDHKRMSKKAARRLALSALKSVGLPIEVMQMYPHELSGGMKQRVIIAMAIALKPKLVVADEPTTALDVVVQRGILQLLRRLKEDYGMTVIMVSHDMAAHAQVADRIAIMYAGKMVEIGSVYDVFEDPLHPYTKGLLGCVPRPDMDIDELVSIPGSVPEIPQGKGCRFADRCPHARKTCFEERPAEVEVGDGHRVACHLYG